MHESSFVRMQYLIQYYTKGKNKVKVLDVGSCDVNGTYKTIFKGDKYEYVGLDMQEGPNVDIVPQDAYHWSEIADNSFDLVISGQAFEHIEFPWLTIKEIERVLRQSALCIIAAPNSQREHRYPYDCYRYFSDGFRALAKWAGLYVLHTSVAGIPNIECSELWTSGINDAFLVAKKGGNKIIAESNPFPFERRLYDGKAVLELSQQSKEEFLKYIADMNISQNKKIILYGAGGMAEAVFHAIGKDRVFAFADSSVKKVGHMFMGKHILSIGELTDQAEDYFIIITPTRYQAYCEIKSELKWRGINSISFWDYAMGR